MKHNVQIRLLEAIDTPDNLPGGTGDRELGAPPQELGKLPGKWRTAPRPYPSHPRSQRRPESKVLEALVRA